MTPEQRQTLEDEKTILQRKAFKRRDEPGFASNVQAIDARIAEIEAALGEEAEG